VHLVTAKTSISVAVGKTKLDGCIVLNEHNAVFASNRSAICNRCFPGPTQVLDANGISVVLAVFSGLTRWQTDRPRYSVSKNRRSQILLLSTATTTSIYCSSRLDRSDQLQQTALVYCVPHVTTARRSYAWGRVNLNVQPDWISWTVTNYCIYNTKATVPEYRFSCKIRRVAVYVETQCNIASKKAFPTGVLDRWHNCLFIYWRTSCLVPALDDT